MSGGANLEQVIVIVGTLSTVALSVNAFFLRGIFLDLNSVKVKLAEYMTKVAAKEEEIRELKQNQKELFARINKLEREV